MRNFEEKLKKTSKKKPVAGIVFIIIAILFLLIAFWGSDTDVSEETVAFEPLQEQSGELSLEIYYLFGPFAEYSEGKTVVSQLYTAYGTDGLLYLVQTGAETTLPRLGIEVTEENIDTIEPVTIYGYSTLLPNELAGFLIEFFGEIYPGETTYTLENYANYFGRYYLDTTYTTDDSGTVAFYVLAGIFGFIGIILISSNSKENKKRKENYKALKGSSNYFEILNDYEGDNLTEFKKYNMAIGEKYIFDYSKGMDVISLANLVNVYRSNMIEGVYQLEKYIAIETNDNKKFYIAKTPLNTKKSSEFDEILEKLKSNVKKGGF